MQSNDHYEESESRHEHDYWPRDDGYAFLLGDGDGEIVGTHQLDAIAGGADPAEVFAPENEVHHRIHAADVKVDFPSAVEVVDRSAHAKMHARNDPRTTQIGAILGGDS